MDEGNLVTPANSKVLEKQKSLLKSTQTVLEAIADDMRDGLIETVGVESYFSMDEERCSMILELPRGTDTQQISRAIDLENTESWCDSKSNVHIGISPWYSTKDVDQAVLCAIKVIHVLLGLHATCEIKPKNFKQKLLSSLADIMKAQQKN